MALKGFDLFLVHEINNFRTFRYDTLDTIATVEAADYFTRTASPTHFDDELVRLEAGDEIQVYVWTTTLRTGVFVEKQTYRVTGVTTAGVATISKAFDFAVDGDGGSNLLIVDASADRVGISSTGVAPTDGLLHIQSGSAGAVAAGPAADELILEGSGSVGMSFLAVGTNNCNIHFGDPGDNDIGFIRYAHGTNTLSFVSNASEAIALDANQNILFGGASAATTAAGNLHIPIDTSPTAALVGGIVIGSKDSSVGATDATLELWLETAAIAESSWTVSHTFPIWINGTEYLVPLDAV